MFVEENVSASVVNRKNTPVSVKNRNNSLNGSFYEKSLTFNILPDYSVQTDFA